MCSCLLRGCVHYALRMHKVGVGACVGVLLLRRVFAHARERGREKMEKNWCLCMVNVCEHLCDSQLDFLADDFSLATYA